MVDHPPYKRLRHQISVQCGFESRRSHQIIKGANYECLVKCPESSDSKDEAERGNSLLIYKRRGCRAVIYS